MKIDVAINVLGKPYQTTLTLLSLLKHSGGHIDKIYLNEEAANSRQQLEGLRYLKEKLRSKLVIFRPKYCHWIRSVSREKVIEDDVRLSVRYQYAWEKSDKDFLLIIHNDCHFHADVVKRMLAEIGDNIAIGDVGACLGCPAYYADKCGKGRYLNYRPTYEELFKLYENNDYSGPNYTSPLHKTNFNEKYRNEPWPLPACRVNEWCCLININQARKLTLPFGPAVPFGAITDLAEYGLDTGAEWFHDVNRLGCHAVHFPVHEYVEHGAGHQSMLDKSEYLKNELHAKQILEERFKVII